MPKRIGLRGYKVCKRCREGYLPNHGSQKLCPYCQTHPVLKKWINKCKVRDCKYIVSKKGGKGFCPTHYASLVRWPAQKRKLADKREGYIVCKTFETCQIVFKPTHKNSALREKYCPRCRHVRNKI